MDTAATNSQVLPTASINRATFLLLKGLTEFREGRFVSAVEWMERVHAEFARMRVPANWSLDAQRYFILALALHRDKQTDKARESLVRGIEIIQFKVPALDSGNLGTSWEQVLMAHILMREAKELIEQPSPAIGGKP